MWEHTADEPGGAAYEIAAAYSLATMGLAGIVFGVLWMRTRNWLLIVSLHGLVDALSNTPRFMALWKLRASDPVGRAITSR